MPGAPVGIRPGRRAGGQLGRGAFVRGRAAPILLPAYPPVESHDLYREWYGIDTRCPTYPLVNVAMDGDADAFMQHLCSQHYGIAYGDVRAELETVCRLLDIEALVTWWRWAHCPARGLGRPQSRDR